MQQQQTFEKRDSSNHKFTKEERLTRVGLFAIPHKNFLTSSVISKNLNKSDQSRKRSNKQIFVFFKLQYLHRISTQIEKEIRDFLKHYKIRLVMLHSTFNIGKLFPYKDRQSLLHSVDVV